MVQQLWHRCTNHAAMQNLLVHGAQPVITTKSQEYTQVTWLSAQAYSQTTLPNLQINLHTSTMCVKWQMLSTGLM
jgi:hypothetical protein